MVWRKGDIRRQVYMSVILVRIYAWGSGLSVTLIYSTWSNNFFHLGNNLKRSCLDYVHGMGQLSGWSVQECVNRLDMHMLTDFPSSFWCYVFPYKHNTQKVWQTTTSVDFCLPFLALWVLKVTGSAPLQAWATLLGYPYKFSLQVWYIYVMAHLWFVADWSLLNFPLDPFWFGLFLFGLSCCLWHDLC